MKSERGDLKPGAFKLIAETMNELLSEIQLCEIPDEAFGEVDIQNAIKCLQNKLTSVRKPVALPPSEWVELSMG